jgi:hypothetical protein
MKSTPKISQTKYDKLFESYSEYKNINKAAEFAGVTHATARRYIINGNDDAGMPSIHDRVSKVTEMVQDKQDLDLASFRLSQIKTIQNAIGTSDTELGIHRFMSSVAGTAIADANKKFKEGEITADELRAIVLVNGPSITFDKQVKSYSDLVMLMERCLGAADKTIEIKKDYLSDMNEEELDTYLATAVVPKRHRQ